MINIIAKKNGRIYFWEEWALFWEKVQHHQYSLKDFGKAGKHPSVVKVFYHGRVLKGLTKTIRYKSHASLALKIYPQSSLNHVIGLTFLANEILAKVKGNLKPAMDKELLLKAMIIHNVPKGLGLRDVPYKKKSVEHDIEEYRAFKKFIAEFLTPAEAKEVEKIYLLQFCYRDISQDWPVKARLMMAELRSQHWQEIVWFRFIEHLDYLFYGVQQSVHYKVKELIAKMAKEQVPIIDDLKKVEPNIGLIWTPAARQYFYSFIEPKN